MKRIPGYENYAISKSGNVYSISRQDGKIIKLKETLNKNGYKIVSLYKHDSKGHVIKDFHITPGVQRVLGVAYLGISWDSPEEIDHIDGDRLNNRLENLRVLKPWQNRLSSARTKVLYDIPGVTWCNVRKRWISRLYIKELGVHKTRTFKSFKMALKARTAWLKEFFPEHRRFRGQNAK